MIRSLYRAQNGQCGIDLKPEEFAAALQNADSLLIAFWMAAQQGVPLWQ